MPMKVLSFGSGVQTVTLAAMSAIGEIERPDLVVFSDTQWEGAGTYGYYDSFTAWLLDAGLKVVRTTGGSIRADALNPTKRFASMPLWTETGFLTHRGKEKGALRRQCTREYKIDPVNRVIRKEAGLKARQHWKGDPVELWLGISLDEVERMTESPDAWIRLRYPLIERRMRRGDCIEWLNRHSIAVPPKSACIGCPFHDNATWMDMKANRPAEFEDACQFDEAIRRSRVSFRNPVYLHPSLKPLREADLGEKQPDFFVNECAGRCRT